MRFHLQLYPPKFSGWAIVLLVLFLPAALAAYLLRDPVWFIVAPIGIIIALALIVAALPWKGRDVTPSQLADELERHLHGTEGPWDWDDTTSRRFADERLERIRWELRKFDSLTREEDRAELKIIIEALRRGDLPEAVPVKDLTYQ